MTLEGPELGKFREISEMANEFHDLLRGIGDFKKGGCLFLGRFYAQSDRIYFGLNPGIEGLDLANPLPFVVQLETGEGLNPPFCNHEDGNRIFAYWRNWRTFLAQHPDLEKWFNDRVTSAFLVPWRTRDAAELASLNRATSGKLLDYSGELVRKMIEHHRARLLVVAGRVSLSLLNELLDKPWRPEELERHEGPGGIYQWRKLSVKAGENVTVLQVPHFSRANSPVRLRTLAHWLRQQLGGFGL